MEKKVIDIQKIYGRLGYGGKTRTLKVEDTAKEKEKKKALGLDKPRGIVIEGDADRNLWMSPKFWR